MRRRLFSLAVIVSLLLFIANAAIWVRSYWAWDQFQRATYTDLPDGGQLELQHHVHWSKGHLVWTKNTAYRVQGRSVTLPPRWQYSTEEPSWNGDSDQWINQLGFGYGGLRIPKMSLGLNRTYDVSWRYVWIPNWFVQLLTALLPAIWLIRWRRRARYGQPGQCRRCGYDLRATPDRCPECGTAAEATS